MPWTSKNSRPADSVDAADVVVCDDGGSGLFEAASNRFAPAGCEIVCDIRHTVWVKRADRGLSVGLSPWMVERQSVDELLDRVGERLAS